MEKYKNFTVKQLEQELERLDRLSQLNNLKGYESRAQSINIGTAGGGTTEIVMRGCNGTFLWNVYQPVEVVELINQLSASIGCHIAVKPRQDFASWRQWKDTTDTPALLGVQQPPFSEVWPEFANHPPLAEDSGSKLPHPDKQPGKPKLKALEKENAVATKKAVNKRTTKRTRATSK